MATLIHETVHRIATAFHKRACGASLVRASSNLPDEFDFAYYTRVHSDLANFSEQQARNHYDAYGRVEGRSASPFSGRPGIFALAERAESILEIGPGHQPCFADSRTRYYDVQDADGLRRRATSFNENPDRVPSRIHYVSPSGDLSIIPDRFDVVFSSHAIEHQPDLIGHLAAVRQLLNPGGAYLVLMPDRRYCFDQTIPASTIGDVLEAHEERRRTHRLANIIDNIACSTHNDSGRHWAGDSPPQIIDVAQAGHAVQLWRDASGAYLDVHAWRFSSEEMRAVFRALKELGYIPFEHVCVHSTLHGSNEFSMVFSCAGNRAQLNQTQKVRSGPEENPQVAPILDRYVDFPPSPDTAFSLFQDEWSSRIPGYGGGEAGLFEDGRITWIEDQCGGFSGKRVLELGPLEGGHTYMMAMRGAQVTAIESNTRAFLKCLITKNALRYDADFLLGDFRPYLAHTSDRFDLVMMSGVLYHMTEPVDLLADIVRVTDKIGLWSHYFDPAVNLVSPNLRGKFSPTEHRVDRFGRTFVMHQQNYGDALDWAGFCGGSAPTSHWLTWESLLGFFEAVAFDVVIGRNEKDHPNGPCVLLYARRRTPLDQVSKSD